MWAFGVLFFYMLNLSYPFGKSIFIKKSTPTGQSMPNTNNSANRLRDLAFERLWLILAGKIYKIALTKSRIFLKRYLESINKKE